MTYAICFDFPESPEPWFAGWTTSGTLGYALSLKSAARFDDEATAQRTLENSYGSLARSYGAVVEVAP